MEMKIEFRNFFSHHSDIYQLNRIEVNSEYKCGIQSLVSSTSSFFYNPWYVWPFHVAVSIL